MKKFGRSEKLLIAAVILIVCVRLFIKLEKFTRTYPDEELGYIYSNSQYVKGPAATTEIGDDGLIAVAGHYLFSQGGIPTQINFETPPLGEYLVGLSIYLFHNERVINIFYIVIFFFLTYKICLLVFENSFIASLAILLMAFGNMIYEHLIASLLDLPQTLFVIAGFYFFLKARENKVINLYLSSLFLGAAFATKFFPGIIFLLIPMILYCFINMRSKFWQWVLSLSLIPIVYILSYSMFFVHGHSFLEFLQFQKWLLNWRQGNPRVPGNIFLTYSIGRYRSWWDTSWVIYKEWSIFSFIIFYGGLTSIIFIKKTFRHPSFFIYMASLLFIIYTGVLTTGVPKYVFPVFPLLAGLTAFTIHKLLTLNGRRDFLSDILTKRWKIRSHRKS